MTVGDLKNILNKYPENYGVFRLYYGEEDDKQCVTPVTFIGDNISCSYPETDCKHYIVLD